MRVVDINGRIDRLSKRLAQRGLATDKSMLYTEGVREKLRQVQFALSMMQYLQTMEKYGASSGRVGLIQYDVLGTTSDQISFYCDSFWDFLRSAIDILAQLVNEVMGLGLPERTVDFKQVAGRLANRHAASSVTKRVMEVRRSRALHQLEGYRHCSTHRRPVYIETRTTTTTVDGRAGYTPTTDLVTPIVSRYLCDNPSELRPRVTKREIMVYCISLRRQIEDKMSRIINQLP
jgi:hypothetical protein